MRERGRNGGREEGSFKVRTGTTDVFFFFLGLWIFGLWRVSGFFHIYFVKHIVRVLPQLPEDRERVGKTSKKTLFLNATPSPLVT